MADLSQLVRLLKIERLIFLFLHTSKDGCGVLGTICHVSQIISGSYTFMISKIFGPVRNLIYALLLWKEYCLGFENIQASP